MGGKSSTSTQQVSIPQDVLNRYNSVNATAQQVAQTPFQTYNGEFVAPTSPTQNAGIANTNTAASQAQPYYQQATDTLQGAQQATSPYYAMATQALMNGANQGAYGTQSAYNPLYAGAANANALQGAGAYNMGAAYQGAQPYIAAANANVSGAQSVGSGLAGASLGTLGQAQQQGQDYVSQAYNQAQPYNQAAGQSYAAGLGAAQPLNQAAVQSYVGGQQAAQPFNSAAAGLYGASLNAGAPLQQQAAQGYQQAYQGAQPYNGAATGLAAAGAGPVNAQQIGGDQINQFMSPYIQSVLQGTAGMLNQQNQQQQSGQLGDAIKSGAFGGDRAGIAAANLAQQQQLANSQIYSGILNQGYGQALGAAQQQQGVNLGAGQANRAALQNASNQFLGIGQQGYSQGLGAASQQAALGQQLYGQVAGAGQNLQNLGQQQFGQSATVGQGLGQIGNQVFGQGQTAGQNIQSLGQQQYAQGTGTGSQLFNQGATAAGQVANLGQQQFGQGLSAAQQQAALGQQQYSQGMGLASAQTGLGSQVFGQGAAQSQQQAALAQQQYAQGLGAGQQYSQLGQNIYSTGANTAQQLAALGQGAQGASLQGAQAQLAAGQVQQQTQQAQDTALYNQFLQQQSYPFQTAQFLANIAEGTGALSGSTTTTTQPGGFFSDERLKENIKPIGKTNDGQTIYAYNYKGDPRRQIGLLAQEVEHKHPDAVGLAGGYKTVDYGKATEDSERARRADGGTVGYDPAMAEAMLKNEQGMFGPYGASGGLAGHSRVPSTLLPVGHLQVAGGLAPQRSPMQEAAASADLIDKGAKGYDSFTKKFGNPLSGLGGGKPNDPNSNQGTGPNGDGDLTFARGGLADGGMPYDAENGKLDIPDEQKTTPQLATAQGGLGKPRTGMDDAADAAKIATLLMTLNTGGRAQRADGGGVTPDDDDGSGGGDGRPSGWIDDASRVVDDTGRWVRDTANDVARGISRGLDRASGYPRQDDVRDAPRGQRYAPQAPIVAPVQVRPWSDPATHIPINGDEIASNQVPIENTRPYQRAPNGTAIGLHGMNNVTFKDYLVKIHPEVANWTNDQLTAARTDPNYANGVMERYENTIAPVRGEDVRRALTTDDYDPNNTDVRLGYAYGPTGGNRIVQAYRDDPNTPARDVIPDPRTRRNNGVKETDTVRDVYNRTQDQIRRLGSKIDPNAPLPQGVSYEDVETPLTPPRRRKRAFGGPADDQPDDNLGNTLWRNAVAAAIPAAARQDAQSNSGLAGGESSSIPAPAPPMTGTQPYIGNTGALPTPPQPDLAGAVPIHHARHYGLGPVTAPNANAVDTSQPTLIAAPNADPSAGLDAQKKGLAAAASAQADASVANAKAGDPVKADANREQTKNLTNAIGSGASALQSGLGGLGHSIADFGGNVLHGVETGLGGYGKQLSSGDPNAWIPMLKGIAAMGTTPTRNLGVALANGVGTAAGAYYPTQQEQANLQNKQAVTGLVQAQTGRENALTEADITELGQRPGFVAVDDPTGKSPFTINGKHYIWKPTPMAGGTGSNGVKRYNYLDANGMRAVGSGDHSALTNYVTAPAAQQIASRQAMDEVTNRASAARANLTDINQWAEALASNQTGPLQGGPLQGAKVAIASKYNDLVKMFLPNHKELLVDPQGVDQAIIANKLATAAAMSRDNAAGQKSFRSLETTMAATANGSMPRTASLPLVAETLVNNQKDVDRDGIYDEFNKENTRVNGVDRNFLSSDAERVYGNTFTNDRYQREKESITKLLLNGNYQRAQTILSNGTPEQKAEMARRLQSVGLLRYFTGATNGQ